MRPRAVLASLRRGRRPIRFGSLGRTRPLGTQWGYDRGTPIDRWYIERFLEEHRGDIRGSVLEIKDSAYTERFGSHVTERNVLDVDATNAKATYVADLSAATDVPTGAFDCFVLTQTLQYVYDLPAALAHVHRVLRPGGVVLASVPVTSRLAPPPLTDFWRLTPLSAACLFEEAFGSGAVRVEPRGNVLAQIAFLEGLAVEDLRVEDLALDDPDLPLLVCVRAIKTDG